MYRDLHSTGVRASLRWWGYRWQDIVHLLIVSMDVNESLPQIMRHLPEERQVLLYSATFPVSVKSFCGRHMSDPYEINLMEDLTLKGVTQFYAYVEERQKVCCLFVCFSSIYLLVCLFIY